MYGTRQFETNVWGYIIENSCGLIKVESKHNGASYLDVIKKAKITEIASKKEKNFMQNNALNHKTNCHGILEYKR